MKNVLCPSCSVVFFVTITCQRKMGHKVHEGCTKYTKITAGFSYKIFFKKRFILSVHCGSLCTSCPSFNGFKDGLIVNADQSKAYRVRSSTWIFSSLFFKFKTKQE